MIYETNMTSLDILKKKKNQISAFWSVVCKNNKKKIQYKIETRTKRVPNRIESVQTNSVSALN